MAQKGPLIITRRDFIKRLGLGSLAFSSLASTSLALADPTKVPPRLLLVCVAHGPGGKGMVKSGGTETRFTLESWLEPLKPVKEHLILIDGLLGTFWGNAHDTSYSHLFTSSVKPGTPAFTRPRTPSLDVILEGKLGRGVLPVQRLWANRWGRGTGSLGKSLSYDTSMRPLPFQGNPTQAFQSIVNNVRGSTPPPSKEMNRKAVQRAIFDGVTSDLRTLRRALGGEEAAKLEYHLQALQTASANLGLNTPSKPPTQQCKKPNQMPATNFATSLAAQLNNIKTVFSCHLSQIAVLNVQEIPHTDYTWKDLSGKVRRGKPCGDKDFHQCVAHYGKDQTRRRCFEGSVHWFMDKFARFAQELHAVKEANGRSLLENTIIVITGEVGDGNHETHVKPHVIIGGRGAPRLRTGRYLKMPVHTSNIITNPEGKFQIGWDRRDPKQYSQFTEADLWREICKAMNAPVKTFGSAYFNNKKDIGIL